MPTVFTLEGAFGGLGGLGDAAQDYAQGQLLFQSGQYQQAAEAFQSSYLASGKAALLYDIGQAYWNAGDLASARAAYQQYLASNPSDAQTVQGYLDQIDAKIGKSSSTLDTVNTVVWVTAFGLFVVAGILSAVDYQRKKRLRAPIRYEYDTPRRRTTGRRFAYL